MFVSNFEQRKKKNRKWRRKWTDRSEKKNYRQLSQLFCPGELLEENVWLQNNVCSIVQFPYQFKENLCILQTVILFKVGYPVPEQNSTMVIAHLQRR